MRYFICSTIFEQRIISFNPIIIQPRNTHMDFNIAAAFYFAARSIGFLHDDRYETTEGAADLVRYAHEYVRPTRREGMRKRYVHVMEGKNRISLETSRRLFLLLHLIF